MRRVGEGNIWQYFLTALLDGGLFSGYGPGMTGTDSQIDLNAEPALDAPGIVVNSRCVVFDEQGMRVVVVSGVPVFSYQREDEVAEALFVALAQELGYARPGELTAALDLSASTVYRARQRYLDEGASGLVPKKRGPRGARLGETREAAIRKWHREGKSALWMAQRLGVAANTVRNALLRMGLSPRRIVGEQEELLAGVEDEVDLAGAVAVPEPGDAEGEAEPVAEVHAAIAPEGSSEPATETGLAAVVAPSPTSGAAAAPAEPAETPADSAGGVQLAGKSEPEEARPVLPASPAALPVETTLDPDPLNREIDRALAVLGQLNDAAPLFASGKSVAGAGVLLAVPLLLASGVFQAARETFGPIGPAFYGLRTTLLTLLFMALRRIKHPENVKGHSPPELGRVLGLDRAPEVKTIRRKLSRLVEGGLGVVEAFLDRLVRSRVESRSEALGFLYVDGHVRVYSGQADLPKTHVARMRISLPATQDMWVNDADGAPLFFVTQEAHPSLVSALSPILGEIRKLVGPERRVTVVFDRGGWSPELFQRMDRSGFDVLTYRKGKADPVPAGEFVEHVVPGTQGKRSFLLHDKEVTLLRGKFSMRQVTRLKGDHQTQIVTTRRDLGVMEVALRMFDRWRQENFFKYMRQEYAIDALVEHGMVAADRSRLVPNPARKALDKQLDQAKKKVEQLEAKYGAAAIDNQEKQRRTMRGFKIAHGTELGIPLRQARALVTELVEQRSKVPTHVPVGEVRAKVVRLPRAKKRLTDGLKMLAYQVETDLVRAVAPSYARCLDEGRPLITAALRSAADLEVTEDELRVTLAPQSSPHRSRAIAELCTLLDATETTFPGSSLRLRYAVAGGEPVK